VTEILQQLQAYDLTLFKLINQYWVNAYFDQLMPFVTNPQKTKYILFGAVLGLLALYRVKGLRILLGCLLTVLISDMTAAKVIKPAFQRQRPLAVDRGVRLLVPRQDSPSFPSNHAANCFGVATYLSLVLPPSALFFYFVALLIAYSRVYVGVHYPGDVFCGALLGILAAFIVWKGLQSINLARRSDKLPEAPWKRSTYYKDRWKKK
jgi:undecaprenyl-diphosphatase